MNGPFYIGATGLSAGQRALDVVANNIANINTPSFKRAQVRFAEMLSPGALGAAPGVEDFAGVRLSTSASDFSQGEVKATGNPLDLAIDGDGFLELAGPQGQTLLTRGGALKINADGYLATADGLALKSMISAPLDASAISIQADGQVVAQSGDGISSVIGRIDMVRVKDPNLLAKLGDGLFAAENTGDLIAANPGEDGAGRFVPGALESSNVDLAEEMVALLMLQRTYSANAQVVQAGDQLMAIANGLRR